MNLDINKILENMLSAIKGEVGEHWGEVKSVAENFLKRRKERLELLAEMRISGDLSQEKFESRLEDEKLLAEAEFNAIAVLTKAMVQRAANAAIDVLTKAVDKILGSTI